MNLLYMLTSIQMPLFTNNPSNNPSGDSAHSPQPQGEHLHSSENKKEVDLQSLLSSWDKTFEVSSKKNQQTLDAQEQRFTTVKYKAYTLVVLSIAIIAYGPLVQWLQNTLAKRDRGSELSQAIEQRIEDQKIYQATTDFIKKIEANKSNIISCFNIWEGCETIEEEINDHKDAVRWYLQIGELKKEKMDVDENKILRSINEFLLESSRSTLAQRDFNWVVYHIRIGTTQELENNIIRVPVDLMITFENQDNVIDFLKNLEERVFYTQEDGLNGSILYMIDQINYDIVNYTDAQDVSVSLSAYAYNEVEQ